jgi:hypothetical protein
VLVATGDSSITEPGVPPGIRRTGRTTTLRIPVADRFEPRRWKPLPQGYLIDPGQDSAVALLRRHGIVVRRLEESWSGSIQRFEVDSVQRSSRTFQGHRETAVRGRWGDASATYHPGMWAVDVSQPLGRLAAYLLEPESEDGLVTWGIVDVEAGAPFPVVRAMERIDAR